MEDVESSWRVRECGEFIFLGQPGRSSHRKWQTQNWARRFALVLRLLSRYRWERLKSRSKAEALSRQLYAEYYGREK